METITNTVETEREQEIRWIREAQQDPAAFRPLYVRHHAEIFRFLYRRLGDKEPTADLTSEVFATALAALPRYQITQAGFVAWLYQIAIRAMLNYFRHAKKQRHVVVDEHLADRLAADWEITPIERAEQQQKLAQALQQLAPEELTLIELRFFEERPFAEVADLLDLTESHARVKTYRILDKLRKLWKVEN